MMFRLYDSKGGYQGSFPSWQAADNYRFAKGNSGWSIKRVSYCVSLWTLKK